MDLDNNTILLLGGIGAIWLLYGGGFKGVGQGIGEAVSTGAQGITDAAISLGTQTVNELQYNGPTSSLGSPCRNDRECDFSGIGRNKDDPLLRRSGLGTQIGFTTI